jgi:hypothetical protein
LLNIFYNRDLEINFLSELVEEEKMNWWKKRRY